MQTVDHYATLGLHRKCTEAQIRTAYRLLAKAHHPDLNPGCAASLARTQALNAAYEILSDPARREAYDHEPAPAKEANASRAAKASKATRNITEELSLKLQDFLRGVTLEVRVKDPTNPEGIEVHELNVPPETAPGARFKLPRVAPFAGGFVLVRVRARPDFRFKVRGSDLRCDLRITSQRATLGGSEMVAGLNGNRLRVTIPRGVERGEVIRLAGEGLPKPRGGRGDLLVRITYRPEVRFVRAGGGSRS